MGRLRLGRQIAVAAAVSLILAACVSPAGESSERQSGGSSPGIPVVAVSSYPLAFIAQTIGGDEVEVVDLSTKGGHAHDMELSPAQIGELSSADVVLYLSQGFQPAVETAIERTGVTSLDGFSAVPEAHTLPGDPHVWLNPMNVSAIGDEVARLLDEMHPENDGYYAGNAQKLTKDMEQVDADYAQALAGCMGETLLTSHEAFGYLAARFDLEQVGVMGIDPDAEPSPARLREILGLISERGITTLFTEPTGQEYGEQEDDHDHGVESGEWGAKLAKTLGVAQQTLDPLEVQVNPNKDMIAVFNSNLVALEKGLPCAAGN